MARTEGQLKARLLKLAEEMAALAKRGQENGALYTNRLAQDRHEFEFRPQATISRNSLARFEIACVICSLSSIGAILSTDIDSLMSSPRSK